MSKVPWTRYVEIELTPLSRLNTPPHKVLVAPAPRAGLHPTGQTEKLPEAEFSEKGSAPIRPADRHSYNSSAHPRPQQADLGRTP